MEVASQEREHAELQDEGNDEGFADAEAAAEESGCGILGFCGEGTRSEFADGAEEVAQIEAKLGHGWRENAVTADIAPVARGSQVWLDAEIDERNGDGGDTSDGEERKLKAGVEDLVRIGDEQDERGEGGGIKEFEAAIEELADD